MVPKVIPKFPKNLLNIILPYFKKGMFKAERTSKKDFLSGPRPETLGVVTNRLRSSIKGQAKKTAKKVTGILGTNVHYGRYHEYGTKKMQARPFLKPALEMHIEEMKENFKNAVLRSWDK